jgi:hypothetical protein
MGVNDGRERGFGSTPNLMGGEARTLSRKLIVERDGMGEGQRPEVTLIVLRPPESSVDHHGAPGADGVLDGVFRNPIVVMTTNPAMFDPLAFGGELGSKFLGSVDPIVGAIRTDMNTSGGGLSFKAELGLDRFGAGETDLVDHRELGTGGVAKDGTTTELLSG